MEPVPHRVLITADTLGGVWTYSIEMARGLTALGVEVGLAAMGRSLLPDQRKDLESIPELVFFGSDFRLEWMQNPWAEVALAGEWLLEIAERFSPDVIHSNTYAHSNLPWHRPVVAVAHSCVTSWWHAIHGCAPPEEWAQYRSVVKAGLRAADILVAPSRAMLNSICEHYGTPENGRVIHNGRSPAPAVESVAREPLILCAGRLWDQAKNIAVLSDIADHLRWPVVVAGEDTIEGRQVECCSLRRLGRLAPDTLRHWMQRASIYVSPARYEPFGLSILEAAQSGCALVLGDLPSLREIWGDAAMFVPPTDRSAFKSTLNYLAEHPAEVRELGVRASRAAGIYTLERMCGEYLRAYRDAAAVRAMRAAPTFISPAIINDGPVPILRQRIHANTPVLP